jgi:hypothetical protein
MTNPLLHIYTAKADYLQQLAVRHPSRRGSKRRI